MTAKHRLTDEERRFFALVKQAANANPFSDERVELDLKISGQIPDAPRSKRVAKTLEEVGRYIRALETQNRADLNFYSGEDQSLVRFAFLFDFFYRFRKKIDQLILDQMRAGDDPVTFAHAQEAIALMHRRGFNEPETARYVALGYQLRRAFFFIDRSLVGDSPAMKNLRKDLWNNIFTQDVDFYDRYLLGRMEDFSTLILGETGAGKGTAAMAIGRSGFIPFDGKRRCFSESFTRSFVSINLSLYPETLIESELFGYKKGAFTGAVEDHAGAFDQCSPHGAILLDEIGELPAPLQIKLLQILQDRIYSPVGSHAKKRFHGRVIAATNRALNDLRENRIFRDDFYYRLCSDVITVPPLRQRIREDPRELRELLAFTVEKIMGQKSRELTDMAMEVIKRKLGPDYPWPGNVRELEQCVRRILLKRDYLGEPDAAQPDLKSSLIRGIETGEIPANRLMAGYCQLLYQRHGTFEEVARRTNLDRRTVKKNIKEWGEKSE